MPRIEDNDQNRELARKAREVDEAKLAAGQVLGGGIVILSLSLAAVCFYFHDNYVTGAAFLVFLPLGIALWNYNRDQLRQYDRVTITADLPAYRNADAASEQIHVLSYLQSGRSQSIARPSPWDKPRGRVFVRREFGFWFPASVESCEGNKVQVQFDDLEDATVDVSDVVPVDLHEGDQVFVRTPQYNFLGIPAIVVSMRGEVVIVHFLSASKHVSTETVFLCDVAICERPLERPWKAGDRVLAFYWRHGLFQLAIVQRVFENALIEVEFHDGESDVLPCTLLQSPVLMPGDSIYVGGDVRTEGTVYERCELIAIRDESIVARDLNGNTMEVPLGQVASVPKGCALVDGKIAIVRAEQPQ